MRIFGIRRQVANAALLVVLSFVCGLTAAGLNGWYEQKDFHCFWAAGRIVASGGDPYDARQYAPAIMTIPPPPAKALERCGLPLERPAGASVDDLVLAMRVDKKARAGTVRFSLPRAIGVMHGDAKGGWTVAA